MAAPLTDIEADPSSPSHFDSRQAKDEISPQPKEDTSQDTGLAKPLPTSEDTPDHQQVDPSPTDSSGTDSTYIEDDTQENRDDSNSSMTIRPPPSDQTVSQVANPQSPSQLKRLNTAVSRAREHSADDGPASVIHIPSGFKAFKSTRLPSGLLHTSEEGSPPYRVSSPATPDAAEGPGDEQLPAPSPSPVGISHRKTRPKTPSRQVSFTGSEASISSASYSAVSDSSFSDQGEVQIVNIDGCLMPDDDSRTSVESSEEQRQLRAALAECWTLCNTLEGMSADFRRRIFAGTQDGGLQETAWTRCWKLCIFLCDTLQSEDPAECMPTLINLCSDFTRARFEGRYKTDTPDDALLKVSFAMNLHLYNIRDTSLPPAFTQRTMEFWIALCHRLMRKKSDFPPETESLLVRGWSLAKALYDIQFPASDEELGTEDLLSVAVQACFELSDLFRDGWIQFRPDRSTPKPGQSRFVSSRSSTTTQPAPPAPPETPVTIFDDLSVAPSPSPAAPPNILVLGQSRRPRQPSPVSSAASSAAGSHVSRAHLQNIHALLVRAAVRHGFIPSAHGSLRAFVDGLSPSAFGTQPEHVLLLAKYKDCVTRSQLRGIEELVGRTYIVSEVAAAVLWLLDRDARFEWFRSLFEYVLGVGTHQAREDGRVFKL